MTIQTSDQAISGNQAGEGPEPQTLSRADVLQLAFWACLLIAVAAASIAIAWPEAVGGTGPMLLISMAAGGMVFLLWVLKGAGRKLGLFPQKGAAAEAVANMVPRFGWIEAMNEAVLIADPGGAPIAANEAYRALTRVALSGQKESAAPVSVDRLFSSVPGLAAPVFRLSKAAKASETSRELLPPMTLGANADPVQYLISVAPLPRGQVMWRLAERSQPEQARGSTDTNALYVEDAPVGFFAARPDGRITYANAWLRQLIGLPETARNVRLDDVMRPEFVRMLGKDRKTGMPGRASIMLRTRDGVEMPVQAITTWSGKGVDAQGRTIILTGMANGGEREGRFTSPVSSRPPSSDGDPMFNDAPFGVARLEGRSVESAKILDANRALKDIAGDCDAGTMFADLFTGDEADAEDIASKLADAIDKPVGLKLAGETPRSVNVFVSLDNSGYPSVAYVIDMTEQKDLEMRLAQGEKMQAIGQLAGGVAHDFNNVLTGIMLNNDELMTRHPVGDPSYENLKSIHEFSVRAKDLVHMLLAYARQQTFKREIFNPTDFLSEFSILLRQILDERIEFKTLHGRNLPYVKADKNQLETAIINLVTNARDAMLLSGQTGGKLTIRTSAATAQDAHEKGFTYVDDGDYLLIEVQDTGHGIPANILNKIFQPFFTTKDVGVGTGLGLATVYGIIKQSEGYICPSSKVGEGTTFHIYLPALKAEDIPQAETEGPAEEEAAEPRPMDISGRGRILLVEDEKGLRDIAVMHLISRGYDVESAGDGEEALEILEDEPGGFDLIISDVVMPGMDGPTLIREAKPYLGDARVIFVSGYAERDVAKKLDDDREISFLPKPFNVRQLAERVKQQLGVRKDREAA